MEIALIVLVVILVCFVAYLYRRNLDTKRTTLDLFENLFEEPGSSFQKKVQLMIDRTEQSTNLRLESLGKETSLLHGEVSGLRHALRDTTTIGKWGEIQLRRVFELAGMVKHVDFVEQKYFTSGSGEDIRGNRPDAIINLPNNRSIFVDAKTSLDAYLSAAEATNEEDKSRFLKEHAKAVRRHVVELSRKNYPVIHKKPEENILDFVLMFIPGDLFLAAAADSDPNLIEDAISKKVLLCTPSTLIAVLQTVEHGWHQEQLTDQLKDIQDEAYTLIDRMGVYFKYIANVGRDLEKTVDAYNKSISSFEGRLLPALDRFQALAKKASITNPSRVESSVRSSAIDEDQET